MSDPNDLASVKPIASDEELREKTGDAEPDAPREDRRSFLGVLVGEEDRRQDDAAAPYSETTENSEG